ncbi:alpha-glucosidase [Rothia nasimurium]|uniref:Alpha-glucosidase n=1 Tax=Rothia nasimurium TaxID=85336 RepID=A0A4Y9F4I0_9MICC|nr:alpha-glucosidase [Rothia nasimurium]MBF0808743.1 alpha-glucosidase [Rothia nasimurium]TFU21448.1 alpha-glucosidase [Rothia nasimurium]
MAVETQWWQEPVVYQIYPRSFNDSNGDGIGDLPGITEKIPYLAKLGVDVIWLSPIYKSPNDDNGYDISDYRAIMDEFGTMADFDELLETAHAAGIKIMMDLVVNHTSDEHDWFVQAKSSRENPYRDYYIWKDPAGFTEDGTPIPPNNWVAAFSPSVWEWEPATEQFYLHLFSTKQPDLNWENPVVRKEVYDLMRFWLDKGVDGFRMDVINLISKDPAYPDDPQVAAGGGTDSITMAANGPRVHEYLAEMNREVLSHYPVITVGEAPGVTAADGLLYTGFERGELQTLFQFEHMGVDANPNPALGKWNDERFDLRDLKRILTKWQVDLAGKGWNANYWNNHDQPRAVSRFGNDSAEYRVVSAKMLGTVLHGMQGTPYIYQGEELGMTNVFFTDLTDYNDLEIHDHYAKLVGSGVVDHDTMLRFISASGRDNARTPMQWTAGEQAGFTSGTPWLKLNPRYTEINAEAALADESSVFYHYRDLISLRHTHPIMVNGTYELIDSAEASATDDAEVYAYLRHGTGSTEHQTLLVVANFTDGVLTRTFTEPAGERTLISSNYSDDAGTALRPYEAKIYLYEKD